MIDIDERYRELCLEMGKIGAERFDLENQKYTALTEIETATIAKDFFGKEAEVAYNDATIKLGDILFQLKDLHKQEHNLIKELEKLDELEETNES